MCIYSFYHANASGTTRRGVEIYVSAKSPGASGQCIYSLYIVVTGIPSNVHFSSMHTFTYTYLAITTIIFHIFHLGIGIQGLSLWCANRRRISWINCECLRCARGVTDGFYLINYYISVVSMTGRRAEKIVLFQSVPCT